MSQKGKQRSVGRPRVFEEEVVLDAVLETFWRRGYEATSMSELCASTGLHKGSLYQTFGDKHQLFMRALLSYAERQAREVAEVARRGESPLATLLAVARHVAGSTTTEKGCMLINAMVEMAPHDAEVQQALRTVGGKHLQMLADLISRAQQAGELRIGTDPMRLARQLLVTLAGAAATAKGIMGGEEIAQVFDDLIESWT